MNLPIPVVGVDPGPDWALNINACLTIVDSHDHTNGKGVQITPNGLNINSTLSVNGNDVIDFRTVRFSVQGSVTGAADLGCLYVSGEDLYFNDENGNVIQITQNGGVAGSPGSISNLTSPASAAYVAGNQTFVWQSAVNTAANMDFQSAILRNSTASSYGLTLSAPNSMTSNYSIILPFLPVTQSIMTIDSSGNIATPAVYPLPNAGMATMPDQTIKGNVSGSVAAPSDLTASQVRTMIAPLPTATRLSTVGTGTYTPPSGCRYIRVSMVGGGAGVSGQTSSYFKPTIAGGATYTAGAASSYNGGTPTVTAGNKAGIVEISVSGGNGANASVGGTYSGASSVYGGASASGNAKANTGAGGSGGTISGGAGAYLQVLFTDLDSSYSYRVGAGGIAGAYGAGGSGHILIEEFYI